MSERNVTLIAIVLLLMLSAPCAFGADAKMVFVYERPLRVIAATGAEYDEARQDPSLSVRGSRSNSDQAWVSKRVVVRDEKHLLELLGAADGNTLFLSEGQKALLEAYRFAQTDKMKANLKDTGGEGRLGRGNPPGQVTVTLADSSGFSKGKLEKDFGIDLKKDMWPRASGTSIFLGSAFYSWPFSAGGVKSTLVHEFAHCIDGADWSGLDYGKDNTHSGNEMTNPASAFVEGWAEYNEMLAFGAEVLNRRLDSFLVKEEDDEKAGKYRYAIPVLSKYSGRDLLAVEAIDANILYRLSKAIPDGPARIKAAFLATNSGKRDIASFLKAFVAANPEYAQVVAKILDQETKGKLSESDFDQILGNETAVDTYFQNGRKSLWARLGQIGSSIKNLLAKGWNALAKLFGKDKPAPTPVPLVAPAGADAARDTTIGDSGPITIRNGGRTPFDE